MAVIPTYFSVIFLNTGLSELCRIYDDTNLRNNHQHIYTMRLIVRNVKRRVGCRWFAEDENEKLPFRRGKHMRYTETTDDSAVSPVIGVILMVAITVILAAVIGTFVLGLGENVDGTTSAGVSVEQTPGTSFQVNLIDTGNLDTAGIVGPDGTRSAFGSTDDVLAAGATTRVAEGSAWNRDPAQADNSTVIGLDNPVYLVAVTDASGSFDPTLDPTATGP